MIRFFISLLLLILGLRLLFASSALSLEYLSWGFSEAEMRLAGLGQIVFSVVVWFKKTEILSLMFAIGLSSIAFATHWRLEHATASFLPSIILLILVLIRLYERDLRSLRSKKIQKPSFLAQVFDFKSFERNSFEKKFKVRATQEEAAEFLNDTKTFTKGQIFPYRCEFIDPKTQTETDKFKKGVFTNHHGPFLSAAGCLTNIDGKRYRDLQYAYGSYAISFRLFRLDQLEMWFSPRETGAIVSVRFSVYCRRGFGWFWSLSQYVFWQVFAWSIQMRFYFQSLKTEFRIKK
ncbi:MAG: hypothetical protein ACO3LE_07425 [Bdellovibrionota bacterium]